MSAKNFKSLIAALLVLAFLFAPATEAVNTVRAMAAIFLPTGLTRLDDQAFAGDYKVSGVITLPEKVTELGQNVFAETQLFGLVVPAAVKKIPPQGLNNAAYIRIQGASVQAEAGAFSNIPYVFAPADSVARSQIAADGAEFVSFNELTKESGFYFKKENGEATLLCAVNNESLRGEIKIPAVLSDNTPVTALSAHAMMRCGGVTHLQLPLGIREENGCFEGCAQAVISYYSDPSSFYVTSLRANQEIVRPGTEVTWIARTNSADVVEYYFEIAKKEAKEMQVISRSKGFVSSRDYENSNRYSIVLEEPGDYVATVICRTEKGAECSATSAPVRVLAPDLVLEGVSVNANALKEGETIVWSPIISGGNGEIRYSYALTRNGEALDNRTDILENTYTLENAAAGEYSMMVKAQDDRTQTAAFRAESVFVFSAEEARPAAPVLQNSGLSLTPENALSQEADNITLAWESVSHATQYGVTIALQEGGSWKEVHHAAVSGSKNTYTVSAALFADITAETLCRIGVYSSNLETGDFRYYYIRLTPHVIDPSLTIDGVTSLYWHEGYYAAATKSFTIESELPVTITAKNGGDWYSYSLQDNLLIVSYKENNTGTYQKEVFTLRNGVNSATLYLYHYQMSNPPLAAYPAGGSLTAPVHAPMEPFYLEYEDNECDFDVYFDRQTESGWTTDYSIIDSSTSQVFNARKAGLMPGVLYRLRAVGYKSTLEETVQKDALVSYTYVIFDDAADSVTFTNGKTEYAITVGGNNMYLLDLHIAGDIPVITTDADWLSVYLYPLQHQIKVTPTENTSASARTAHATITCGNASATLTVTQESNMPVLLHPLSLSTTESSPTKIYLQKTLEENSFRAVCDTLTLSILKNGTYTEVASEEMGTKYANLTIGYDSLTTGVTHRLTLTQGSLTQHYYLTFASNSYYISVDNDDSRGYNIPGEGGSTTLTLRSSGSWTAACSDSWLSVSSKSGSSTSGKTITITASANTTGFIRQGTVLFKRGSYQQASAIITQYPVAEHLSLSWDTPGASDVFSGSAGGEWLFVDCIGDWTATVSDDWLGFNSACSKNSTAGSGKDEIKVYMKELGVNESPRTGKVTVTSGSLTQTIQFTQLPLPTPTLLSPNLSTDKNNPTIFEHGDLTLTWQAAPHAVYYTLTTKVRDYSDTLSSKNHAISADGSQTYSFTIPQDWMLPDTDYICSVVLRGVDAALNAFSQTFYFTVVSGEGVFIEGKTSKSLSSASDLGDSASYTITSTGPWTAATSHDWIKLESYTGVSGDSLKVLIEKNYGEEREGTVTLTCGNKTATLYVYQEKWIPDKPSLSNCTLSTDMANPAIIDHNTASLSVTWEREYLPDYYQLRLYEVHTTSEKQHFHVESHDDTLIASGKNLEPKDRGFTFENLSLTPGALYLLDFYRTMPGNDRREGKTHYYFMASTEEDPYVYIYDTSTSETDEFESGEDGYSYKIVSNGTWRAESDSDWLMVGDEQYRQHELTEEGATPYDYNTYTAMDDRLVISALANTSNKTRTGHVTLTIPGGNSCTITCVQLRGCTAAALQSPALTDDRKNPVWLPYGDVTLRWNASPDGAGKYTVTIKEKLPDESRFYEIYETTTTNTSLTLPISELTANADYNVLLETWVDSEYTVCNAYYFHTSYENALTVTASVNWTDTNADITAQASGGSGSKYQYAFSLLRNGETVDECPYGNLGRYGFHFSGAGTYQIQVHVIDSDGQKQSFIVSRHVVGEAAVEKYISVSPSSWAVPAEGGEITLAVSANSAWNVSSAPAWLSADVDDENGKAYVTAKANPGQTARTGVVVFTCGNASASLAVTQNAPEAAEDDSSIALTESSWVITTDNASSRTLKITASGPWAIMESPAWVTLSQMSGEGNETITLYAQPNTGNAREGKITFACGSASASLIIQQMGKDTLPVVTNFTMSETEISTGIPVSFTVTAQDADSVILVVDGKQHETHALVNGSITFTRTFSSSGNREIRFLPLRGSVEGLLSIPQTLKVTSQGDLAPAVIHECAPVIIGNDAFVSWGKVANAENYTVYLSWSQNQLWKKTLSASETSCTIPASVLSSTGAYTCVVMAAATGYKQSEASIFVKVITPVVDFSIASPMSGEEFIPSNTVDIQIDNPSRYHIAVKITDAEGTVTYLPENKGTVNDAFISGKLLYTPAATGKVTVQAMAFPTENRTADGNAWYETARNISFTIADDSPLAKMIYLGGSSSRSSVLVSELTDLKVKTNKYVTGVRVYLDGTLIKTITDYTVSGSDRIFSCDLPTATEGLHRYMTEVYSADGRTHQRTYTLYVVPDTWSEDGEPLILYPANREVLFRATPATPDSQAEKLPLSAELEMLGLWSENNLAYVRYGTRRGFASFGQLRTTQVIDYNEAIITFTSPTKEVAGFMYDEQHFIVRWNCSMELPSGASFALNKRAQGTSAWSTLSHVTVNSKELRKENLGVGTWELSVGIIINGTTYARTMLPYVIRVFADSNGYMEYLLENSDYAGSYLEHIKLMQRSLGELNNLHDNFVRPYYIGNKRYEPLEIDEMVDNAVFQFYRNVFGDGAVIPEDTASKIAVVGGILDTLAPQADKIFLSSVYDVLNLVLDGLNIPPDVIESIVAGAKELGKSGKKLTALGDVMENSKVVNALEEIGEAADTADLVVDFTNAVITAIRYSLIDDDDLLNIGSGFLLSSNASMKEIGNVISGMSSTANVIGYSLSLFSLDVAVFGKNTVTKLVSKFISELGVYGKIYMTAIDSATAFNDFAFNTTNTQNAAVDLQWKIDATEAYRATFSAAVGLFASNPAVYYDEMISICDTYLRLIDAEYQALANFNEAVGNSVTHIIMGIFSDCDEETERTVAAARKLASERRTFLRNLLADFYANFLVYTGVEYIPLPAK